MLSNNQIYPNAFIQRSSTTGTQDLVHVPANMERRCQVCGAKASGKKCDECGSQINERTEIGILNGVHTNYGTVNAVYNMGSSEPTEVVDTRDIQDMLNERYPERIPPRLNCEEEQPKMLPAYKPNTTVKVMNVLSFIFALGLIFLCAMAVIFLMR
jgi:hypothetical protein